MIFQHRGKNNGDLAAAFSVMREKFVFKSEHTVQRALKQLLYERLIHKTREGRFLNPGGRCALYALSWLPVDDCPGKDLDMKPTRRPFRTNWDEEE